MPPESISSSDYTESVKLMLLVFWVCFHQDFLHSLLAWGEARADPEEGIELHVMIDTVDIGRRYTGARRYTA